MKRLAIIILIFFGVLFFIPALRMWFFANIVAKRPVRQARRRRLVLKQRARRLDTTDDRSVPSLWKVDMWALTGGSLAACHNWQHWPPLPL